MNRSTLVAVVIFSIATLIGLRPARAGLTIGGWNATRNSIYGINGSGMTQLDADIAADFPSATITSTATLTATYLATINVPIGFSPKYRSIRCVIRY